MDDASWRKRLFRLLLVFAVATLVACDANVTPPSNPADSAQAAAPPSAEPAKDSTTEEVGGASGESVPPQESAEGTHRHPPNRLAEETSPYLLLHAHNPVRWYPWGEEALAKARQENKLIFLSIGYSSCYWCHVMERESFMDEEIAALLNEHFVAIKVDREERPDIDEIYMTSLQYYLRIAGVGGSGGWPLSMFLTPDAKPVLGGTYFPPRDAERRTGFLTVLRRVHERWQENPESFRTGAAQLSEIVTEALKHRTPSNPPRPAAAVAEGVTSALKQQFDPQHGGFGYSAVDPNRPKFPEPSNLLFLLQRAAADPDGDAREMLLKTLTQMAGGGIRDHLGGGFHRYSTDRYWRIPHFEKMLYDNGQLATVYARAYALAGDEQFRQVVRELLEFVSREMTDTDGAFYAALDAETDAEEGRFYAWEEAELKQVLSAEQYALFQALYVTEQGADFEGRIVPRWADDPRAVAEKLNLTIEEFTRQVDQVKTLLLNARNTRPRPLTDTKILTAWNGLMIRGYADAGRLLNEPSYTRAARRAADFILDRLLDETGRLRRTYGQGEAKLNAYLDDYAFLIDGLIALDEASGDAKWLQAADRLMAKQIELFWDAESGGFFFTSHDHEQLLARSKDPIDSVLPSGNAVSVGNLVYLGAKLNRPEYLKHAEQSAHAFSDYLADFPAGMPRMALELSALDAVGTAATEAADQ